MSVPRKVLDGAFVAFVADPNDESFAALLRALGDGVYPVATYLAAPSARSVASHAADRHVLSLVRGRPGIAGPLTHQQAANLLGTTRHMILKRVLRADRAQS